MGILDKLLEKKDLAAYCNFRMQYLHFVADDYIKSLPLQHREKMRARIKGRIEELEYLLHLVNSNQVKKKSIFFSDEVHKIISAPPRAPQRHAKPKPKVSE